MPAAKMIAALDTIEAGLQQLAAGVTTFTAALQVVSGAMYPDHNQHSSRSNKRSGGAGWLS